MSTEATLKLSGNAYPEHKSRWRPVDFEHVDYVKIPKPLEKEFLEVNNLPEVEDGAVSGRGFYIARCPKCKRLYVVKAEGAYSKDVMCDCGAVFRVEYDWVVLVGEWVTS
ncbi:hypothetical protein [Pyrococcus kukulkanii]|uniref:hypothetical protein n=1 Tax=Pyrococcus kukulkanii TaxID=1609559 RepID=UPI003565D4F3